MKMLNINIALLTMLVILQQAAYPQLYGPDKVKLFNPSDLTYFWTVEVDSEGTIWAGSSHGDLVRFKNQSWSRYTNPQTQSASIRALDVDQNNNVWYGSGNQYGLFGTVFNDTTFDRFFVPDSLGRFCCLSAVISSGSNIYFGGRYNNFYKLNNNTWTMYDKMDDNTPLKSIRSFAKDSKGNIWFSDMTETLTNIENFYKNVLAKFDGNRFTVVSTKASQAPNGFYNLIATDKNDNIWYGTFYNTLMEYNGQTFIEYFPPSGMLLSYIYAVAIDLSNNKWISASNGLYKFFNNSWTKYNYEDLGLIEGNPGTDVFDIVVDKKNNLWMASNWGIIEFNENGIDNSGTTEVEENSNQIPESYSLSQNYPNPFNPSTVIKFDIKEQGLVTLKIYDILGREVQTVMNEEKPAGSYKFNFYANGLPSGVYFYRITANKFVQTKKLTLMK